MRGNGKIFISHTHADNALCQPLLAALDAWGVDYWFDTQQLEVGQQLSEELQQAIRDRDIFIRICTANTPQSYWMTLELSAFRSLQLGDQQQRRKSRRITINLVLDPRFVPGPADNADYVVAAYNQTQAQTLAQLRAILELPQAHGGGISRRSAIGLGAAGVVALAAAGGAGTLLVEKGRTSSAPPYPKPNVIAFDNPQTLDPRIRWYFKTGDDNAPGAALAGGVLYVSSSDGIYALKPDDGSILWANANIILGLDPQPVVAGKTLYIAVGIGNIGAFNTSDGSQVWSTEDGTLLTGRQFTVAGGVLYELTGDGAIHAYNASTGARLWAGGNVGKPTLENLGPTVANGVIYVGGPHGLFSALSAANGSTLWTYQASDEIDARPLVAGGLVYFGSNDQNLYALNAATGALVWRYSGDFQIGVAPVIAGKTAYIGIDTSIYALDAASGKLLWKAVAAQDASTTDGTSLDVIDGQPAIAGNTLYVSRGTYFYAMDLASHAVTWRFTVSGNAGLGNGGTPIVSGGVVYCPAATHTLYALSAT